MTGWKFDPRHMEELIDPERYRRERPERWFDRLGIPRTGRILDLGIGPGFYIPWVLDRIESPDQIVGADTRMEMLQRARTYLYRHVGRPIALVQVDEPMLPFRTESFDVILCAHLLHEFHDRSATYRELHRILRPAGVVWFWDWSPDGDPDLGPPIEHRLAPETVLDELRHLHWTAERVTIDLPDRYFIRVRKP